MKNYLLLIVYCLVLLPLLVSCGSNKTISTVSPDKQITIVIHTTDCLSYSISYQGKEIVANSNIELQLSDKNLGINPSVKTIKKNSFKGTLIPLYGKFSTIAEEYNESIIEFNGNFSLVVRAYNEGVAYRFKTNYKEEIVVKNELVELNVVGNPSVVFPETSNLTSWELMYIDYKSSSAILDKKCAITPVLFSYNNTKLVVAESDLRDYPGMYIEKNNGFFKSKFAQYPDSTSLGSWGFVSVVQKTRDYIAKTNGAREFPWRVFILTDDDKSLLVNELVYKLASPSVLEETSWIKPGKAAWEWWHDAMLPGSEVQSGMDNRNTALYKHYVDFAAENNLEYLMVDAGWSDIFDLSNVNKSVDIQDVITYANSKDIGVFLWCTAMSLTDRADEYLEMISSWGAKGIKVDFFDRDDQLAMLWYEDVAALAAKHKLMVNFHGCSKPTGLQRTYPNILNFEAVRGEECSKWDLTANPKHHVTFPFVRMLCGPIDYTPGGLRNCSPQLFRPIDPGLPSVQGTRCHELAMFVIFDQYFAMLSDSPSEYRKDKLILDFLSEVPVSFENTIVLDAKVGEYISMAKKKNNKWYVGAMTDWSARDLNVDFSFLEKNKKYVAKLFKDGVDANLWATHYLYEEFNVNSSYIMSIPMAAGGGFVLIIELSE